eukprot:1620707-Prymnesium_polylepis.1
MTLVGEHRLVLRDLAVGVDEHVDGEEERRCELHKERDREDDVVQARLVRVHVDDEDGRDGEQHDDHQPED